MTGDAHLEASVESKTRDSAMKLSGEVSRINKYNNQSHCVDNETYKKYCYCKDLLPLDKH